MTAHAGPSMPNAPRVRAVGPLPAPRLTGQRIWLVVLSLIDVVVIANLLAAE